MTSLNTVRTVADNAPDSSREITHEHVAYLDTLMREARCRADSTRPTEASIRETDRLSVALGLPPVLTYEAIVLFNPLDEAPRTFLNDPEGRREEILFYRIHRDIECELYPVIRGLLDSLTPGYEAGETFALRIGAYTRTVRDSIARLGMMHRELSKNHFDRMRPYFGTPDYRTDGQGRHYPGPSGASSAAFVALDTLLGIERDDTELTDLVRPVVTGRGYATMNDVEEARTLVAKYGTLEKAHPGDANQEAISGLAEVLARFRAHHR